MERQKFEAMWRNAFAGVELDPSDAVWTNVELELERNSGGKMKRRLLFFQLLAAASTVFAMGVSGIYYLNSSTNSGINFAENPLTVNGESKGKKGLATALSDEQEQSKSEKDETLASVEEPGLTVVLEEASSAPVDQQNITAKNSAGNGINSQVDKKNGTRNLISVASAEASKNNSRSDNFLSLGIPKPLLVTYKSPQLNLQSDKPEADAGELLLARLEAEERAYREMDKKEKRKNTEKIWTSVGVGAGTFNPNTSGTSTITKISLMSDNPSSGNPASSNPSTGSSYTVGVSVGGKVAKRLVVQGGLLYLTQNSEFTSSAAMGNQATLNDFSVSNTETVATSPYKVNSNLQFVSIPVQAGYIVVDRAFAVQLNGGVATDFFLQGTLTPEDSKLEKVSQGAGSDSPYRSVNFSGLIGTELSYKLSDHHRIALNPGMRYTLNSIYKSNIPAEISPVTFDVSLRFKYIFK